MGYIKQLDALRAIAIFFVLCNHWLPVGSPLQTFSKVISAPDVFFTISGFLITMILLKGRKKTEAQNTSRKAIFADFFLKRSLRIFPAYFLTLLLTFVLLPKAVPHYGPFLTFTANFDMYSQKYWGYLGHLWSMSVEQQFYLIWPVLIVFIPKKFLVPTIVLFIFTGIVCQNITPDEEYLWMLPHTCFDALGIGALLAWVIIEKKSYFPWFYKALRLAGVLSILLIIVPYLGVNLPFIHHRTLVSLLVAWLIAYFISEGNEAKSGLSSVFLNRGLLLVGKMSYGIYLYHLTLFHFSRRVLKSLYPDIPVHQLISDYQFLYLSVNLILLLTASWLSWKFFELPLTNLWNYFRKEQPIATARQVV
ncbi:acyltransferase family protein [Sabulibacter ruber]|uniref:acyltransferase family protein n=1 Tax=Sabulibacter ruber TaxID=2811901 RepID=UPI001A958D6D|nr:acyltransferase [Sabulibacter ruber]